MKKKRIFIADNHDIVRRGIRPLLEADLSWEVCGEAADGRDALAGVLKIKPDIVILDVTMPGLGGVEITRQIKRELPKTEVLIFTAQQSENLVRQFLLAGASGFLLKGDRADDLIPAIKALSTGQPYLGPRILRLILDQYMRDTSRPEQVSPDGLTQRERQIVQLLTEGLSNKEVATTLAISIKTVEAYRASVMKKFRFKSFSELVRYAVRNHIVPG